MAVARLGRCIFTASYAVARIRRKMAVPGLACEKAVRRICSFRTSATAERTGLPLLPAFADCDWLLDILLGRYLQIYLQIDLGCDCTFSLNLASLKILYEVF
jgi:hypothetical protein